MIPKDVHPDFRRQRLSPHFVYESWCEERDLFFNRGSIGFVLKGWPLVGANITAEAELADFIKQDEHLPAGSALQVMLFGTSSIDSFLNNWASRRKGEIFEALAAKRKAFLQKRASKEGTIKDLEVMISLTQPTVGVDEELIMQMERRRDVLIGTLKSMGMQTQRVSASYLVERIRNFLTGTTGEDIPLNPNEILSEQILLGDEGFEVTKDEVMVDVSCQPPKAIKDLEVIKRPSAWSLPFMDLFLGDEMKRGEQIKSDFLLSFGLMIPELCLRNKVQSLF